MNSEIVEIIRQSTFTVCEGRFVYAAVRKPPPEGTYFLVARDEHEITVVALEERIKDFDLMERNKDTHTLIALNVSVPFYSVGFLATVSAAIAEAGMNIFIVSTYSKDYILVREDCTARARDVLIKLGFSESVHEQ